MVGTVLMALRVGRVRNCSFKYTRTSLHEKWSENMGKASLALKHTQKLFIAEGHFEWRD